jgi:hypothetical protein
MTFGGFGALQRVMDLHKRFTEPFEHITKTARMFEKLSGSNKFIERNSLMDSVNMVSGNSGFNSNQIYFESMIKTINGNIPDIYKNRFENIFQLQSSLNSSFLNIFKLKEVQGFVHTNDLFIRNINNSILIALAATVLQREWDETETYEDTLEKTVELLESAQEDGSVNNYLSTVTSHLNGLILSLSDNKANLGKAFFILTVIGTILGIIGFILQISDNTKEELKSELDKTNSELYKQIQKELGKNYQLVLEKVENKRRAVRRTGLMTFPKSKSPTIEFIKEGQIVSVTEFRGIWILISYLDQDSNLPKTGWVLKKYFVACK